MKTRPPRRTLPSLLVLPLLAALGACGDEEPLSLEQTVQFELFTEIAQTVDGAARTTQRATVVLSPSLSRADVDKITRLRLVHDMAGDWVIGSAEDFVAGERGWELVAERPANRTVATGPWNLRMVVEEEGVHVESMVQRDPAVGSATFYTTEVSAETGEGTLVWVGPSEPHEWTLDLVRRTPTGEDTYDEEVLTQLSGSGGRATWSVGFGVPVASFQPPHELFFRLEMANDVSHRTQEGLLVPTSPPGPSS